VFRESISLGFGPDPHQVPEPVDFQYLKYFMIGTTLAVFAALWFFFEKTLWGKSFEAVALNRRAAALVGINLSRVTAASFAGGAAVAGLAGLLVAPNTSAHYLMGVPLAIQGFTALVIGGVGRVEGALLGGLLVAFAEQLTVRYAPLPAGYAQGVPLLLLMLFLLVRPTGLLRARGA
jgi:branched-chain amino acid transport system permease protein